MGTEKKLRKLERRVEELEAKVEQLEKRTNESKAIRVVTWLGLILQIVVSVVAIVDSLLG